MCDGNVLIGDNGSNGLIRSLISEDPTITFNGKIDDTSLGRHTLLVTAVTTTTNQMPVISFNGDIGATTALKGLKATTGIQNSNSASNFTDTSVDPTQYVGTVNIAKNVTTIGDQIYTGNTIVLGDGTAGQTQSFTTNGGDLIFNVGVEANNGGVEVASGSEDLKVSTSTGAGSVSGSGAQSVLERRVATPTVVASSNETSSASVPNKTVLTSSSTSSGNTSAEVISSNSGSTAQSSSQSVVDSGTISTSQRQQTLSQYNELVMDRTDRGSPIDFGSVTIESNIVCNISECFDESL